MSVLHSNRTGNWRESTRKVCVKASIWPWKRIYEDQKFLEVEWYEVSSVYNGYDDTSMSFVWYDMTFYDSVFLGVQKEWRAWQQIYVKGKNEPKSK